MLAFDTKVMISCFESKCVSKNVLTSAAIGASRFFFGVGGSGRRPVSPPTPGSGVRGGYGKRTVGNSGKGSLEWDTGGWRLGVPGGQIAQGGLPRVCRKPDKTVGISIGSGSGRSPGYSVGRMRGFLTSAGSRKVFSGPQWMLEMTCVGSNRIKRL